MMRLIRVWIVIAGMLALTASVPVRYALAQQCYPFSSVVVSSGTQLVASYHPALSEYVSDSGWFYPPVGQTVWVKLLTIPDAAPSWVLVQYRSSKDTFLLQPPDPHAVSEPFLLYRSYTPNRFIGEVCFADPPPVTYTPVAIDGGLVAFLLAAISLAAGFSVVKEVVR